MPSRPITPAPRRKNPSEQETEFTSEGAPPLERRVREMAIAALLSVPLLASAGERDREHDRDREAKKFRAAMSFNDLARKDVSAATRGEPWSSRWNSESDSDDERESWRRWPHEGSELTSQVPEPGDGALLHDGLAAIGFVVRRRLAE